MQEHHTGTNGSGNGHQYHPKTAALAYVEKFGWSLFPCWEVVGERRKKPRITHGFLDASNNPAQIEAWWTTWPEALIGVATGASHLVVLDVDVKDPTKYGPDSLDRLGHSILDNTWIAHSQSGGWHCYYDAGGLDIRSTTGAIGPGLDVRARGGYIIAPSPGSGYTWDPFYNPDNTIALVKAPAWLIPPVPAPETIARAKPIRPVDGLSPYADAAIEFACQAIRHAPDGQQRVTLLKEAFAIGTLAAVGGIAPAFARAALIDAGYGMTNHRPREPWTGKEIARVVNGAFDAGIARPRSTAGGRATP